MRTVLVVEDEIDYLEIMQVILEHAGYKVILASDGMDGLALIHRHHPDIVLLDDMLPGITGADICLKVKSEPEMKHIPIVLFSAGPRLRSHAFRQKIGADAFLLKPCSTQEVVQVLNNCFKAATAAPSLPTSSAPIAPV